MSIENSASDSGALGQRIDRIEAEVRAVHAGLGATRTTRWILLLGLVVVIGIAIKLFYGLYEVTMSPEFHKELAAKAQAHFEGNQKMYINQVKTLMDDTTPVVQQAFLEQSKKDYPKYMAALNKERDGLMEDLKTELQAKVNARQKEALKSFEEILIAEFPEAKDPAVREKLIANMSIALEDMVKEYYFAEFERELNSIAGVWDKFPAASAPGPEDPPLERQLLTLLLDLMVAKAQAGTLVPDAENNESALVTPVSAPATR